MEGTPRPEGAWDGGMKVRVDEHERRLDVINGHVQELTAVVHRYHTEHVRLHEMLRTDIVSLRAQLRVVVIIGVLLVAPLLAFLFDYIISSTRP